MGLATSATELYREGRLSDAINVLGTALRDDPTDAQSRTFLFELLCFSGSYERAGKQLDALGSSDAEAHLSTRWYRQALNAQELRLAMFRDGDFPDSDMGSGSIAGTLNGKPFRDLLDADPRIGPRLEAIVGGRYTWIPFRHLASVEVEPPTRLRDLFWARAHIEGNSEIENYSGDVLLPVLTPMAWQHPDEAVRLGRVTEWQDLPDLGNAPVGQKLWIVDDEDFPILEARELVIEGR